MCCDGWIQIIDSVQVRPFLPVVCDAAAMSGLLISPRIIYAPSLTQYFAGLKSTKFNFAASFTLTRFLFILTMDRITYEHFPRQGTFSFDNYYCIILYIS